MDQFDGEVKNYSYRSAIVRNVFMILPRDACKDLEHRLAKEAGVNLDNHTVYEVTTDILGSPKVTYIGFSDFKVYFGSAIEKARY